MSKAKEYFKTVEKKSNYDMTSATQISMRLKGIIVAEDMSRLTLEDVEELADSIGFQDPAVQEYYDELKSKLKTLKYEKQKTI